MDSEAHSHSTMSQGLVPLLPMFWVEAVIFLESVSKVYSADFRVLFLPCGNRAYSEDIDTRDLCKMCGDQDSGNSLIFYYSFLVSFEISFTNICIWLDLGGVKASLVLFPRSFESHTWSRPLGFFDFQGSRMLWNEERTKHSWTLWYILTIYIKKLLLFIKECLKQYDWTLPRKIKDMGKKNHHVA